MYKKIVGLMFLVGLSTSVYADSGFGPYPTPPCPEGQVWDYCDHTYAGPGPCVPQCVAVNAPVCPEGQVWDDCNHTYAGPGPCVPQCVTTNTSGEPTGPTELCIGDLPCQPVVYQWLNRCVIATSILPPEYEVLGWAGPCLSDVNSDCPDIKNQAHRDLYNNALRSNRAQNALGK